MTTEASKLTNPINRIETLKPLTLCGCPSNSLCSIKKNVLKKRYQCLFENHKKQSENKNENTSKRQGIRIRNINKQGKKNELLMPKSKTIDSLPLNQIIAPIQRILNTERLKSTNNACNIKANEVKKKQLSLLSRNKREEIVIPGLTFKRIHRSSSQNFESFNRNIMTSLCASSSNQYNFEKSNDASPNELYNRIIDVNDKLKGILLSNQSECNLPKIRRVAKPIIVGFCTNIFENSNFLGEKYDPYNYKHMTSRNRTKRTAYGSLYK